MNNKRLDVFDALKGFAIIGVILIHSGSNVPRELSAFPEAVISCGNRGVQMFFLISAMLTYKSLSNYSVVMKRRDANILCWYKKKFIRLIPLYWLTITAIFIRMGMTPTYASGSQGVTVFTYIANYLFLHGLYPWYINAIGINWYIGTLAIFLFIAPIIFIIVNNIWKAIAFFALSWVIQNIIEKTIATWDYGADTYVWNSFWNGFSIFKQLPVIAIGIILFFLIFEYEIHIFIKNFISQKIGVNGAICIYWLCFVLLIGMVLANVVTYADIYIFAITFSMITILLFCYPIPIVVNKLFVILGKYSYGIYLFHPLMLGRVNAYISNFTQNALLNILVSVLVTLVICLVASIVLTNYFERTIIRYLQYHRNK